MKVCIACNHHERLGSGALCEQCLDLYTHIASTGDYISIFNIMNNKPKPKEYKLDVSQPKPGVSVKDVSGWKPGPIEYNDYKKWVTEQANSHTANSGGVYPMYTYTNTAG